jgi:aryl-alcohol dehydrogenase-like predicted oxidoreductase
MQRRVLGRTNLEVSVAGLGAGGGVQLGLRNGASKGQAASIVRLAFDLGINFFDTAHGYGTEDVVAAGLKGIPRDQYVLSTKFSIDKPNRVKMTNDQLVAGLDNSLKVLGTDCIDIFQLHGIDPVNYGYAIDALVPVLLREKEKGKFRFLGATEFSQRDLDHVALGKGLEADLFDVIMVAFSMVNQNARDSIFPRTKDLDVGTLIMFASRNLFGYPERLKRELDKLVQTGELPDRLAGEAEPLKFLIRQAGAENLVDAAYRYARDEPGAHVVLFGTGNPDHVRANVEYLSRPPLPKTDRAKLRNLFGVLVGFGVEPGMTHAQIEAEAAKG